MESPSLQSTTDTPKKKKKSRKSKTYISPSPDPEADDAASSPHQEDDQSREKKRKRNSESGQQKNKNKNKNPENGTEEEEPINSAEYEQTTAESEHVSKKPRVLAENGSEDASENALESVKEELAEDVDLTKKGKPKKPRGPRIGGKNGQRVGFYTKDEVQLLESFKVNFCNEHSLTDHKQFDTMVQHSERAPVIDQTNSKLSKEDWPGPDGLKKEEFWAEILAVLPQRDERSLKRFMRRHFQDSTQKPHEWTPEQDEELVNLMTLHPGKFAYVGRMLGRSDDDVTQRWYNQLMHRDKMRRGKWNEEELRSLLDAIQEIWNKVYANEGDVAGKDMYELADKHLSWNTISNSMGNVRTRQQCSDKWRKVRKAVEGMRAAGNPDAQFDPVASVNKPTRWSMGGSVTPKSQAMVMEDDEEEDVDMKEDQLPTASNGLGITEGTPGLPLPSETGSDEPGEASGSEPASPSGDVPSSSSSLENDEASSSKKKRKQTDEEHESETKEERKARRKEEREKRKTSDQLVAAIAGAHDAPDSSQKKKKKKSKKSMDAAEAEAEDEVADTPQSNTKNAHRSSDANGASDDEEPATESPTKKKKSKKSKSLEA